jgi:plasmid stabilization system protein ParE
MNWRLEIRPEVEFDVAKAAIWYESQQPGLGGEFVEDVIQVWDVLAENPLHNSRQHPRKNLRWCHPKRFPFRVIYKVLSAERSIVVAAVLHAAGNETRWQPRMAG